MSDTTEAAPTPLDPATAGEHISTESFWRGTGNGVEEAAKHLMQLSGEAYAKRDDERAKWLRTVSDLLMPLAKSKSAYAAELGGARTRAFAYLTQVGEKLESLAEPAPTV